MAIGCTSLAGLVMSVQLFSPSFLVSFGALCFFLRHILSLKRIPPCHPALLTHNAPSSTSLNYPVVCLHQMNGINMKSSYGSVTIS